MYSWNPANIMFDLSILATSDRNKPLLIDFVALVTRAIELRISNQRMVKYAIHILSQLYFEPKCRQEFDRVKSNLLPLLKQIIQTSLENDVETSKDAIIFKASLEEKPKSEMVARRSSAFRSLFSKAPSSQPATPNNSNEGKHIMISYQWDSQPIAIQIQTYLKACGFNTWFDLENVSSHHGVSLFNTNKRIDGVSIYFKNSRSFNKTNCLY